MLLCLWGHCPPRRNFVESRDPSAPQFCRLCHVPSIVIAYTIALVQCWTFWESRSDSTGYNRWDIHVYSRSCVLNRCVSMFSPVRTTGFRGSMFIMGGLVGHTKADRLALCLSTPISAITCLFQVHARLADTKASPNFLWQFQMCIATLHLAVWLSQ